MFIIAVFALVSLTLWTQFETSINNMSDDVVDPYVKNQISDLNYLVDWSDKLFVFFFMMLMIAYLISSVTIPVEKPIYIFIFGFLLVFTTVISMFLSNAWVYLTNLSIFSSSVTYLDFTDFFLKNYPVIVFFTGIIGGILFYTRKESNFNNPGGDALGFE